MMIEPDLALAERLFAKLHDRSFDGVGITRDAYGVGEQMAHDVLREAAEAIGLVVTRDAALNLYMTLPGRDPDAPAVMTGSHLDSVPRGGNFDGAAGVLAGLAVLAGWKKAGHVPSANTTVMAIRAEESAWFPVSYPGSKAAFGKLPAEALGLPRFDTKRSLAEHISALGGAPEKLAQGRAHLDPRRIACFVELHIEQGPVLIEEGRAVGVVTGIRGSFRYREAKARGAYAHSGATPRSHRRDAVVAVAELVTALNRDWAALEAQGCDLVVTFGRFATDAVQADFSKVSGRVDFCIDVRSFEPDTLEEMERRLKSHVKAISERTRVTIDLGARTSSDPATMAPSLRGVLMQRAEMLGIDAREMPCGAGHDAAVFALQGVPTAMIFVRNAHGSHNPLEHMEFSDFAEGARLLSAALDLKTGVNLASADEHERPAINA